MTPDRPVTPDKAPVVLLVAVPTGTLDQVREVLDGVAVVHPVPAPRDELESLLERVEPDVVMLPFDEGYSRSLRDAETVQAHRPHARLVALAGAPDAERIRAAMRAGFREYVVLPDDAAMLREAVQEAPAHTGGSGGGRVVAVAGTKGGCGATLLAVNLAAEVARHDRRVLVVDLDFAMGDVALMLDLVPETGIADVKRNLSRLDRRLLEANAVVHPSRLHVLAQPQEPEQAEDLSSDDLGRILEVAASAYDYVFLDCGARADEATLTALTLADRVLMVFTPTVPAVRNAWRRLRLLDKMDVPLSSVRLVTNRWSSSAAVSRKDIEANLGRELAAVVSDDPRHAEEASNDGRLLREVSRRAPLTRDVEALLPLVVTDEEKASTTRRRMPFFG